MKKLKNDLHEVSTVEIFAAGTLFFCVGAVAVGWPAGSFSQLGDFTDWLTAIGGAAAAAGTWAIGVGANRYAQLAHNRQVAEATAIAEAEHRLRVAQIQKLRVWVEILCRPHSKSEAFVKKLATKAYSTDGAYGLVDGMLHILLEVDRNDEAWKLLDAKGVEAKSNIGIAYRRLRTHVQRFKEKNPDRKAPFTVKSASWKYVEDAAKDLYGHAQELAGAVDRIPCDEPHRK